jgi:hypothetical protein
MKQAEPLPAKPDAGVGKLVTPVRIDGKVPETR